MISVTHLNLFLAQLQNDGITKRLMLTRAYLSTGYSIFVVEGALPVSVADRKMASAHHTSKTGFDGPGYTLSDSGDSNYDTQLAMAISASLNEGWHYIFWFFQ